MNRTERIEARIAPDSLAVVRQAAEMQGRSLSEFVVAAAEAAARQAIEDTQVIRLSAEDQRRFADALLDPPEMTASMRRAHDRRRRLLGEE